MNKDNIKRLEADIYNFLNYQIQRCENPDEIQEMDQAVSIITMQWAIKTLNKHFTMQEIAMLLADYNNGKDT